MKDKIILAIKGFFMGIANIIPGVSGGTLAITMGIYEDLIEAISHFFSKIKENFKFLIPVLLGAVISVMLYKKIKGNSKPSNIFIFILTFSLVIGLMFLKSGNNVSFTNMNIMDYILLFIVGVIASATMIIPGISGSFMLMVMGYYKPILHTINSLTSFQNIVPNMLILIPFGLGVLVGLVLIAKVLEYLFNKFEVPTYFGIIGFVLASIIGIFTSTEGLSFTLPQIIASLILFVIGFVIALKLGDE